MPDNSHVLERRLQMLAGRISKERGLLSAAFKASGNRPLFSTKVPEREAIEFWLEHRDDDIGDKVLKTMAPEDILELDTRLAQFKGMQEEPDPFGGIL